MIRREKVFFRPLPLQKRRSVKVATELLVRQRLFLSVALRHGALLADNDTNVSSGTAESKHSTRNGSGKGVFFAQYIGRGEHMTLWTLVGSKPSGYMAITRSTSECIDADGTFAVFTLLRDIVTMLRAADVDLERNFRMRISGQDQNALRMGRMSDYTLCS